MAFLSFVLFFFSVVLRWILGNVSMVNFRTNRSGVGQPTSLLGQGICSGSAVRSIRVEI